MRLNKVGTYAMTESGLVEHFHELRDRLSVVTPVRR